MALVIVATAGSHTANSYCTLAEAEATVLGMLNIAAWTAATTAEKNSALVQATRHIDQITFIGYKYYYLEEDDQDEYQALEFPRLDNIDDEGALFIPQRVKDACAIQAVCELRRDAAKQAANDIRDSGVTSYSSGYYSETLDGKVASIVSAETKALLRPWIKNTITLERC